MLLFKPLAIALLLSTAASMSLAQTEQHNSFNLSLTNEIHQLREDAGLVGLSVWVIKDGTRVFSGASGERKKGSGVLVTAEDKWHIGSITKSITATLVARLVEKKKLDWNTRVGDVFDSEKIHESWRGVTIAQLLTHTSGAEPNFPMRVAYVKKPTQDKELSSVREREVMAALEKQLNTTPGSTFAYSNLGYTIAGSMVEKVTGQPWEYLVAEEVFRPLQMNSAEFGPPTSGDKSLEQPRGHTKRWGFVSAVDAHKDLTPIVAPAGRLSMSLADLATYANDHLQGELGAGKLLQPATYRQLHTPVLEGYGYGWITMPAQEWSRGSLLWHNGSNGFWNSLMVLAPASKMAVIVVTNDGNVAASEKVAWRIVEMAVGNLSAE